MTSTKSPRAIVFIEEHLAIRKKTLHNDIRNGHIV